MRNKRRINLLLRTGLLTFALLAVACAKKDEQPTPAANGPIMAANEASAISSLKVISSSETIYQATNGSYGTLKQLADPQLSGGEKSGYKFEVRVLSGESYEAIATPLQYGITGRRSFYLNSNDNQIHAADKHGAESGASDPTLF